MKQKVFNFQFPNIRASFPKDVLADLVGVQPMGGGPDLNTFQGQWQYYIMIKHPELFKRSKYKFGNSVGGAYSLRYRYQTGGDK